MWFSCIKTFFRRFYTDELRIDHGSSYDSLFSDGIIPSLGARINQAIKLKKYVISPFNPRYRAWEMLLVILVVYSAWICPFEFVFLVYKQDALFIIDHIVNGFFAVDIVLTFFVAFIDSKTYLLIDDHKKIAIRYLSTWFIFDVCSTAPLQTISLLFTNNNGGLGFKALNMLRLWRLRRVSTLFARLEKDIHFNYFWTRCTKLVSRDTVRACTEFAARNQLPPRIQDQMLSHVCLKFKTEGLKQQQTLNDLPKALRSNIAQYLFLPFVQKVQLFYGVSQNFLLQLVSEMEAEYFPPREDVILQNEVPTDIYILVSGAVDMVSHINGRDQVVQRLLEGDIFGDIGVLCNRPQPFTVRTTELSQILRLNKTSLTDIIQANKADGDIIMSHLFLKLKALETQGLLLDQKNPEDYLYSEWCNYCNTQQKGRICLKDGCKNQCPDKPLIEAVSEKSRLSDDLRVVIHMQKQNDQMEEKQFGKLIVLPDSIEKLLSIAGQKFGHCFTRIINTENAEVEEIDVIRDGDHLFFLQ
ncbi:potassium channel KAT2-like isoform X2 [Spinacia oleracea]|uniref:Potassium channel n=1 Tax=Spinacia oleracea TaxID=3562 RepID=A0ABM3RF97_SPIOL|nr:potassium channel KAT2-like isoform X2 [Spinacia oleracea]